MDKKLLEELESNQLRCTRCNLIIPFSYKKNQKPAEFTIPSFTLVEEKPVCYKCYHPEEFKRAASV